jgi:hypothetical protein
MSDFIHPFIFTKNAQGLGDGSDDVLVSLTELFVKHGPPAFIRSDNGGEGCVATLP